MIENELLEIAYSLKFSKASIINVEDLVLNKEFRKYCKQNICKNYNTSYSCPPKCGSFNVLKNKISKYKNALILETINYIDTKSDIEIKKAKRNHNGMTLNVKEYLKTKFNIKSLIAGAGNCDLCKKCEYIENRPCKYPMKRFSSLSAYCVDVSNLAKIADLEYVYSVDKLSLVSIIFFNLV